MSIDVENRLTVFEINGRELDVYQREPLFIRSHNRHRDYVVIELRGLKVTVNAQDLERAVKNATNTRTF